MITRQPADAPAPDKVQDAPPASPPARPLSEAARRALVEAEARRAEQEAKLAELNRAKEIGGGKGPEPVRYGDWEHKGIASDF